MMTQIDSTMEETAAFHQALEQIRTNMKMTLQQVMGDISPDMLNEMATIFLEDAELLMNQIKDAHTTGDFDSITMAAHALKGSSATIGLDQFAEVCLHVETHSKQQQLDMIGSNLPALETEYVKLQQALSAFLL